MFTELLKTNISQFFLVIVFRKPFKNITVSFINKKRNKIVKI